jgi:hypothetical protein
MASVTEALPARPLAGTDEALLVAQIESGPQLRGQAGVIDLFSIIQWCHVVNARARSCCFTLDELSGITHRAGQKA